VKCSSRSNPQQAARKLNSASKTLKEEKTKLWIFPEGTRNGDKSVEMLPFKKGAFHVAVNSNLPIMPIVIARHNFLDSTEKFFDSGTGYITVLPLIWPRGRSVEDLKEVTRNVMIDELRKSS